MVIYPPREHRPKSWKQRYAKCGSADRLQAHHKAYRKHFEDTRLDDLASLCYDCHAETHCKKDPKFISWADHIARIRTLSAPFSDDDLALLTHIRKVGSQRERGQASSLFGRHKQSLISSRPEVTAGVSRDVQTDSLRGESGDLRQVSPVNDWVRKDNTAASVPG